MNYTKDQILGLMTGPIWKRIGLYPHHGIDLPLAALHSKNSCGIGEFLDLIPVIDWCRHLKLDVIQLLPLNDSGSDPSPYNAISSCALNPIYLSLSNLPNLDDLPDLKKKLPELQQLSSSQRILFHDVQSRKINWLRTYFDKIGPKLIQDPAFINFIAEHDWLKPYALFKVLKDRLEQNSWPTWPEELKNPKPDYFNNLINEHWAEVSFYIALQYFCYSQLKQVKQYATDARVFLKGDIPILISGDSVDTWLHPEFFDMTLAAGAPPDAYNQNGQYWGFPLYKWKDKKKEQFKWWKRRLACAANFYDIYRIDHVVGFFRMWAIPIDRPAKEGSFVPKNEALWKPQGIELLKMMIASSSMLPIAEDLGVVPTFVRQCLLEFGVCGTKVMRWERNWEGDGRVIPFEKYTTLSLTCVSTHDSDTLQLWWKAYPTEAQVFADFKKWKYEPDLTISQRQEILWDSHHTTSLFHINLLQEYLALFPELIWPNPEDERINIPGKWLPTNWTYRFRPSIEQFTNHENLAASMQQIIKATGHEREKT